MSHFMDGIKGMQFFDPHVHMTSRTTDDYQAMADAGVVALIEPAFWLGQPRTGLATFRDYYSSLIGWERFRSSQYGNIAVVHLQGRCSWCGRDWF
jgi:predicted metal-dependent TIM-barrel fold hydrolase